MASFEMKAQSEDKELVINRLYGTSTALPFLNYTPHNCFDKNPGTMWRTQTGSGPEEGLMISFENSSYISKVEIIDGNGIKIRYFDIYIDGMLSQGGNYLRQNVKNLFIKASRHFNTQQLGGNDDYILHFSTNDFLSISEIRFYDESKNEYKVILPDLRRAILSASSSLSPEVAYGVDNLVDKKVENAWAESASGLGINETLDFHFDSEVEIDEIRVWNGYQRSKKHFSANGRVKKVAVSIDGETSDTYFLDSDLYGMQSIKLRRNLIGKNVNIQILEASKGNSYDDLVISELQFLKNGKSYEVETSHEEERVKSNKRLENEVLKQVLDRNINFSTRAIEKEGTTTNTISSYNSILLRSNNTFVMYNRTTEEFEDDIEEYYDENLSEMIADGNWELKSLSDDEVKIRVFGKVFSAANNSQIYKGGDNQRNLRIIQDIVIISKDEMKGSRLVKKFKL
ncbi:hypothetical protein AUTU_46710 (plasmid) [Aureibacter tunicatorum]|nr:hypothetical protein AUTU_46710 [Aureibacter tunicatorum]